MTYEIGREKLSENLTKINEIKERIKTANPNIVEGLKEELRMLRADNIALRARMEHRLREEIGIGGGETPSIEKLSRLPKWPLLIPLILMLGYCAYNTNPDAPLPASLPSDASNADVQKAYDDACGDSKQKVSKLDYTRKSAPGVVLTEKRRESISGKWLKNPSWKNLE